MYAPNGSAEKSVEQNLIELKGKMDKFTITDGKFFNTLLLILDRASIQKFSKDIKEMNKIINHMDLMDTNL